MIVGNYKIVGSGNRYSYQMRLPDGGWSQIAGREIDSLQLAYVLARQPNVRYIRPGTLKAANNTAQLCDDLRMQGVSIGARLLGDMFFIKRSNLMFKQKTEWFISPNFEIGVTAAAKLQPEQVLGSWYVVSYDNGTTVILPNKRNIPQGVRYIYGPVPRTQAQEIAGKLVSDP